MHDTLQDHSPYYRRENVSSVRPKTWPIPSTQKLHTSKLIHSVRRRAPGTQPGPHTRQQAANVRTLIVIATPLEPVVSDPASGLDGDGWYD